jgi:signal transduction histidine kinase
MVAITSLLAVGVINARLATQETGAVIAKQLEGVVNVLANSNFPLTDAVLKQMYGLSGAEFVLTGEDGEVISTSQPIVANNLPASKKLARETNFALGPQIIIEDKAYFYSVLQMRRPLGDSEKGTLHVLFPLDSYNEAWRSAFLPPLTVGIVTIITVAMVTHWISGRISNNLTTLGASVERLAGGDFKSLSLPDRDDEIRDLTIAVNQTATRLSEYEQHVRQTEQMWTVAMLGAGLAHELRNAATGCWLAVDLHAEGCPVSRNDDSLAIAKSQLHLMENRLQAFLQLGKDQSVAELRPLDLASLVNELVPLVLPAARHAGVRIEWQASNSEILILGCRDSLGMVIVNLLLNAIEAAQKIASTQEISEVRIRLTQELPGFAELQVTDTGPGLSKGLADRLFQPFVTTKPEGVGLGLAVAQQVAETHGGEICWSREGTHTSFLLKLPLIAHEQNSKRNGTHG